MMISPNVGFYIVISCWLALGAGIVIAVMIGILCRLRAWRRRLQAQRAWREIEQLESSYHADVEVEDWD